MPNRKSRLLTTLGIMLALFTGLSVITAPAAFAAPAYPSKPVRLIITWPPGGSNDIVGRMFATKLAERLGKQVIVDNRGGAGGIIGTEVAAKADPDGYTVLFVSGTQTIQAAFQKLPIDLMKSFSPIARLGSMSNWLVVHPTVPANSVKEFVALAKERPGKLIFAASGVGSITHLGAELFRIKAGINFKIVQFKGGGPAMTDLLGGHSQFTLRSPLELLPHIQSGKLRVLGGSGLKRSALLPHVPTIAEAGVPGYEAANWFGILAPAGTPAPIGDRLNKELKAILATDEVKKWFLNQGAEEDYLGPAEFGAFLDGEIVKWGQVVKEANIKVD